MKTVSRYFEAILFAVWFGLIVLFSVLIAVFFGPKRYAAFMQGVILAAAKKIDPQGILQSRMS